MSADGRRTRDNGRGRAACVALRTGNYCTKDPDIYIEEYARRWGGKTVNRQFESARINTQTTKRGGWPLCFAATLITFNAWVMINAILDWVSRMRTKCAPPPCTLGAILEILVYAFGVFPAGPGTPPPPARAESASRSSPAMRAPAACRFLLPSTAARPARDGDVPVHSGRFFGTGAPCAGRMPPLGRSCHPLMA